MADTAATTTAPSKPACRICGHEDYFLGEHLAEVHNLTIDGYLAAYPGSPTVAQEILDNIEKRREKNVRREHPPADTNLTVDLRGFKAAVNADVPADACLPLPDHYRLPEHGDLAIDVVEALISILRGRHTYIHGLPGTGKDALIHAVSALLRRPTLIRQVDPNVDVESWLYTREFDEKGTKWKEQELLVALREGYLTSTGRRIPYIILITDIDRATKSQAEFLRMILDSISGRVRGPAGRIYKTLPGSQIIVTANTAGGGDPRGRMVSANVIDGSILDRFERTYQFHWMDWKDEGPICLAKFPLLAQRCPDIFNQIGKATASLRDAIAKEQLYAEFSHRAVCSWLGHAEDIVAMVGDVPKNLAQRAARAYLDKMPDEETRLTAERLVDPFIKGGVVGVGAGPGASPDPLAGFGR